MQGEYDQLIVIDDQIDNLAKKINRGLRESLGDLIVVSNDDVVLTKGHLKDLCEESKITSPTVNGAYPSKAYHAHMWGMTRRAYDEIGGWSEEYDGFYYDDSDYWMKFMDLGYAAAVNVDVDILHDHPGFTLGTFNNEGRMERNRDLFISKWGAAAMGLTGNV